MDVVGALVSVVMGYNVVVFAYFILLNAFYLLIFLLSTDQLLYFLQRSRSVEQFDDPTLMYPSISIIVPAYNEEKTIVASVKSFLENDYPNLEVVVVNDGSADYTMEVLRKRYRLIESSRGVDEQLPTHQVKMTYCSVEEPHLIVVDKHNGGKADALNAGINYARGSLFCAVDADSIIEVDALRKLVRKYLDRKEKIVALGGIVRIANGCSIKDGKVERVSLPSSMLATFQVVEYIRAFLCGRVGWNKLNILLIISGAFGLFERKTVINAGGYKTDTVGEDMELVVRLHKYMRKRKKSYKAYFLPDPVCWTEVPESRRVLRTQRRRWQRGLAETMYEHRRMVGNPRYGAIGLIGMPYFLFFELLGPVIETTGYFVVALSFVFGLISAGVFMLFVMLSLVIGMLLSVFSLLMEEFTIKRYQRKRDVLKLFIFALLENFGYRQLNSWWRLLGLKDYIRKQGSWGSMERKGL